MKYRSAIVPAPRLAGMRTKELDLFELALGLCALEL